MSDRPASRSRDVLLLVLAVATGATDATAFERLGHVFASVITGNLIVLGVSAVRWDGASVMVAAVALVAYALGVLVAAPRGSRDGALWPAGATLALTLELGLLLGFAVGWEIVDGRPGQGMRAVLLALAAGAMGTQSTAVRRLGGLSTTYLTGTLTGMLEALAGRRWSAEESRDLGIIVTVLGGAAAGTALVLYAPSTLPALQLGPIAVVIVASRQLAGRYPPG